jgi:hypothetical protein
MSSREVLTTAMGALLGLAVVVLVIWLGLAVLGLVLHLLGLLLHVIWFLALIGVVGTSVAVLVWAGHRLFNPHARANKS